MRSHILAQQPLKNNPPSKLSEAAELIGGTVTGEWSEPNGPDGQGEMFYIIEMRNKEIENPHNIQMKGIKLEDTSNSSKVQANIYFSIIDISISFDFDSQDNIPAFAVPASLIDTNSIQKSIKYKVINNNNNYNVRCVCIECKVYNTGLVDYIFIIPVVTINCNIKHSTRYSYYKIVLFGDTISVICPKIIINKVSTVYKPFFVLPRRIYPIWVYIEAITLYMMGIMTQRQVAEEIRKKFKILNFSASTISRIINSTFNDILNSNLISSSNDKIQNDEIIIFNNPSDANRNKVFKKINIIIIFFSTIPSNIFSNDKIINAKIFAIFWFQQFSRHFLIPLAWSKLYVIP